MIFTSKNIRKSPRDPVSGTDVRRAEEKVPRGHYKVDSDMPGVAVLCNLSVTWCQGLDFSEMSDVLNGWLNSSALTKPCLDWDTRELQQLQALLYLARESQVRGYVKIKIFQRFFLSTFIYFSNEILVSSR